MVLTRTRLGMVHHSSS